jgi:hypothetical protein
MAIDVNGILSNTIFLVLSRLLGEPIGRFVAFDPYMRLNPPEVVSLVLR